MTYREKQMISKLKLTDGYGHGTTPKGNTFTVAQNDTNINRPMFQLCINGVIKFNRGGISKVFEEINAN